MGEGDGVSDVVGVGLAVIVEVSVGSLVAVGSGLGVKVSVAVGAAVALGFGE